MPGLQALAPLLLLAGLLSSLLLSSLLLPGLLPGLLLSGLLPGNGSKSGACRGARHLGATAGLLLLLLLILLLLRQAHHLLCCGNRPGLCCAALPLSIHPCTGNEPLVWGNLLL